jgi:hypothetical protein
VICHDEARSCAKHLTARRRAGRDQKNPVKGQYHNKEVDWLACVLTEFGRAILEEGRNILLLFESKQNGRGRRRGPLKLSVATVND